MWGNRFGWGISAVICLAALLLGYLGYQKGQPTVPTGELVAAVKPLALADAAKAVLPPPKPLGDAGPLYRQAIAEYHAHQSAYDAITATKDYDPAAVEQLKALDDLVAATNCPTMDLFASKPAEIINYDQDVPALDDLQVLAKVAEYVVTLAAYDKDYKTADKYAAAVLGLGYHLYQERLTYGELEAGISLMGTGSEALKEVAQKAGDKPAAAAQLTFNQARLAEFGDATSGIQHVWSILSGQSDDQIARYAGDYFQLADDPAADRVWRVEAIRRLGRLQRNAATHADNVRATRYLDTAAARTDLDPVLHQAAVSARDITSYQNQSHR